jgi:Ca2+-binding RTX toxin-like protein
MAIINGTNGNDTIRPPELGGSLGGLPDATADADTISGLAGDDRLFGGAGDDTLDGGDGDDDLTGGPGTDSYVGGAGNDAIRFEDEPSGITVNLTTGLVIDGFGNVESIPFNDVERVVGTAFDDALTGIAIAGGGRSHLRGNAGNDIIGAPAQDTTVTADHLLDPTGARVNLSANAALLGGVNVAAFTALDGFGGTDTLINIQGVRGSAFADFILGSNRNDRLEGEGGDDTINGGAGNDTIRGLAGNDTLNGETGNDTIEGGDGDDLIDGGDGNDTLRGGNGNDTIRAGVNSANTGDSLFGDAGDDILLAEPGNTNSFVNLYGGTGNDTINGGGGASNVAAYDDRNIAIDVDLALGTALVAGGETDTLIDVRGVRASDADDVLRGSDANESFWPGLGTNLIDGRGGIDQINYYNLLVGVSVDLAAGIATHLADGSSDTLISIEDVGGTNFNDTLLGNDGDNLFRPLAGNDLVDGRGGHDTVRYTTNFSNSLIGQFPLNSGVTVNLTTGVATDPWGNTDTLLNIETVHGTRLVDDLTGVVLPGSERSFLRGLGGSDTLRATGLDTAITADYREDPGAVRVNLSGVEALLGGQVVAAGQAKDGYGGTDTLVMIQSVRGSNFADAVLGSDRNDNVEGGSGNDELAGGAGNDRLFGDAGNDTLNGDDGNDRLFGGEGDDTVNGGDGDDRILGEAGNDDLSGDAGNDIIYAGDGNDLIDGGTGNDILVGNEGDDTIDGGDGNDRINGGADNDTLNGDAGNDNIQGGDGNDVIAGGADNDFLFGQAGDDLIDGGDGNDHIWGDAGDDDLDGGAGNDIVRGGSGTNRIDGGAGTDVLFGGADQDIFVLANAFADRDWIHGFTSGTDKLEIDAALFGGGLAPGALDPARLVANANPVATAPGQFLFDTDNGTLRWDADGAGGGAPVTIAALVGVGSLSAADFIIV